MKYTIKQLHDNYKLTLRPIKIGRGFTSTNTKEGEMLSLFCGYGKVYE